MRKFLYPTLAFVLLCVAAAAQTTSPSMGDYLRYLKTPPASLETAVVTMKGPRGEALDLISAVHVGEASYYRNLNSRFRAYDAVLYELILPEEMAGQRLPSQLESGGALSGLQGKLGRTLGMVTQLNNIDYSPANFVHADLTQEALSQSMGARGESLMSYFQKALANSGRGKAPSLGVSEQELAELNLLAILTGSATDKERTVLKKMMASAMTSPHGAIDVFGDTALLADRNQAALGALDAQMARGRRNLALFYGAAHMPDLEAQLRKRGWKRIGTEWLKAWSI